MPPPPPLASVSSPKKAHPEYLNRVNYSQKSSILDTAEPLDLLNIVYLALKRVK